MALLVLVPCAALPARADDPHCSGPAASEVTCMACNIYFEARGEPEAGQRAVAMVTLNRLRSGRYPQSVCEVVWERRRDVRTGALVAQFSWTQERHANPRRDEPAWGTAVRIAQEAMDPARAQPDPTSGALFFHAAYVAPDWSVSGELDFTTRIGDHLFYRSRGGPAGIGAARPLPAIGQLARFAAGPADGTGAGDPADFIPNWNRRGAKLIRLAAGSSPGTLRVSTYEKGRVSTMQLARENN